jgi:hypothetical protein
MGGILRAESSGVLEKWEMAYGSLPANRDGATGWQYRSARPGAEAVYCTGRSYTHGPNSASSVMTLIAPPAMMNAQANVQRRIAPLNRTAESALAAHDFRRKNPYKRSAVELEGNVWLLAAAYRVGSRFFINRKNMGM